VIAAVMLLAALTLPAVADAPAGAPVDRGDFRYARPLGAVPRGLVSLTLDVHVLARSRALQDVRIVDAKSNQVPYLVVPLQPPVLVKMAVPRPTREGKQSVYRFTLPYDTLPNGTELELTTSAGVFVRDILVRRPLDESRGREPQVIDRLAWQSAPSLRINLAFGRAIEIVVDEGDNASLPITAAQLRLLGFALRFVSPGTPLTLLYGDPSIAAPRYDLALVSSQLIGQPARTIVLNGVAPAERPERHRELRVFGAAIAVAVVVLLITLARLVSAKSS
jgi:hypothetical protein